MSKPSILLAAFFVSALLIFLHFSPGMGRRIHVMKHYEKEEEEEMRKVGGGVSKREMEEMVKMEDYSEPEANTNNKNGAIISSTPPPSHPHTAPFH